MSQTENHDRSTAAHAPAARGQGGTVVSSAAEDAALLGSQDYRQYVFDAVNDAVFIQDARTGRIVDVNQRACEMYGFSRAEALLTTIGEISAGVAPYTDKEAAAWNARARAGTPQVFEWRARDRQGRLFWVEVSIRRALIGERDLLIVLVRDIEDRKRAERDWDNIFNAIEQPVLILTPEHGIVSANRAMLKAAGKTLEELQGLRCFEVCHACGTTTPPADCPLEALRATGSAKSAVMELEAFGGVYLVSCTPVLNAAGRLEKVIHIAIDFTEKRRAMQVQRLESLGVLAGGVAHDFNNLLTTIIGNIELARQDIPEFTPARENLAEASRAARRAAELTRSLLAYSGRGRFQVSEHDDSGLIEELSHLLKTSISKRITLQLRLPRTIPKIKADASQVQQVVMNLMTNAAEAIGDQIGVITVATGVQVCDEALLSESRLAERAAPGRYVFIEVADTGCGMDAGVQQRMFDPFFTTKFTGRGLGLAAVMGVVSGHKGAIIVSSVVKHGTTLRVLFPALESAAPRAGAAESAPPAVASLPGASTGATVLVVDDEESVRIMLQRFLERDGFKVLCAVDGSDAVAVFREHADAIGCVLMDLTMPNLNGMEAFAEMRRLRPDVRVLIGSGYDATAIGEQFSAQGVAGFVQKPYRIHELIEAVRSLCRMAATGLPPGHATG